MINYEIFYFILLSTGYEIRYAISPFILSISISNQPNNGIVPQLTSPLVFISCWSYLELKRKKESVILHTSLLSSWLNLSSFMGLAATAVLAEGRTLD